MKTCGRCQAWSAASSYRPEHRCEKAANTVVVRVDGRDRVLCPHHKSLYERRPSALRFGPTPVLVGLDFSDPRFRSAQRWG